MTEKNFFHPSSIKAKVYSICPNMIFCSFLFPYYGFLLHVLRLDCRSLEGLVSFVTQWVCGGIPSSSTGMTSCMSGLIDILSYIGLVIMPTRDLISINWPDWDHHSDSDHGCASSSAVVHLECNTEAESYQIDLRQNIAFYAICISSGNDRWSDLCHHNNCPTVNELTKHSRNPDHP